MDGGAMNTKKYGQISTEDTVTMEEAATGASYPRCPSSILEQSKHTSALKANERLLDAKPQGSRCPTIVKMANSQIPRRKSSLATLAEKHRSEKDTEEAESDTEEEEEEGDNKECAVKLEEPHEGGWGWVVVFGAFVVYWFIPGMIRSYGAVHLEVLETFPDCTEAEAGWVPAFLSSISIGLAPISAVLGKIYSCRNVVFVGGLCCSLGLSLSYFANSIFYLYITFGLITGIGAGLCTTPSVIVINSYFVKKRALASGFCLSGAAVGSFTIPIFVKMLVSAYTFRGAMLIMGAIILHVSACSLLFTPNGKWQIAKRRDHPDFQKTSSTPTKNVNNNSQRVPSNETHTKMIRNKSMDEKLMRKTSILSSRPHLKDHGTWTPPLNHRNTQQSLLPPRSSSFSTRENHTKMLSTSMGHSFNDVSTASVFYDDEDTTDDENTSSPYRNNKKKLNSKARILKFGKQMIKFLSMCLDFKLFNEVTYTVTVVTAICIAGAFPHVLFFVPVYAKTMGITKVDAAMLLSVCSGVDLVGRIAYGYFMDLQIVKRCHGLAFSCLVCAIGTLCLPLANSYVTLTICTALFGFGSGTSFMLLPVILADNHGVEKLPSTYGLMRLFQGFVMLIMPPVAGLLKDTTGYYQPGFLLMGSIAFGAAVAMFLMPCAQRYDKLKQKRNQTVETSI